MQQTLRSHTCDVSQPEHSPRHPGGFKDKRQPPKFSSSPKPGPGRGLTPARPGSHPQTQWLDLVLKLHVMAKWKEA